jgi:hypothetical protein
MRSKWALAVVVGLVGLAFYTTSALATPSSGFTAVQQWKGVVEDLNLKNKADHYKLKLQTKGTSDLYVTRNAIDPGGQSGWHTHPGPSVVIVTAGEVTVYDGDDPQCRPTRFVTGESFVDQGWRPPSHGQERNRRSRRNSRRPVRPKGCDETYRCTRPGQLSLLSRWASELGVTGDHAQFGYAV